MTLFSKLSPEAQNLIVDALLGKYNNSEPPEMSDAVREEIRIWCETSEETTEQL